MALIDAPLSRPGAAFSFRRLCDHLAATFGRVEHMCDPSDAARRDFVISVLKENDQAFRTEADVQCMMSVYPGRF